MNNLMKAVQINRFGDRSVLELNDIEIPTPTVNEVLIKVKSAAEFQCRLILKLIDHQTY